MLDTTVDETALYAQVRRLSPITRTADVPVTIGDWDQRGYTHCTTCTPDPVTLRGRTDAISGDNGAAEGSGATSAAPACSRRHW